VFPQHTVVPVEGAGVKGPEPFGVDNRYTWICNRVSFASCHFSTTLTAHTAGLTGDRVCRGKFSITE